MVHARYCASYPKWPCVKHEANIWCPCGMISFCSRTFYSLLSSPMINVVTILLDVTYVTVWQITSNPNPQVLKIEKWKINWMKMKMRKKMKTKFTFFNLDSSAHWPILRSLSHNTIISYIVATIEGILAERLAKLFRNNI